MMALDNMLTNGTNISLHYANETLYMNDTLDANQFVLPVWRQFLWTILFAGMVIVATGGNLIVIWIVLANKRMRTVTNYFLLNLSLADAMSSTLNVTFNYFYMLNSHWPFGRYYCKINQFIAVLSICASVFSLMAISIDRYMAIMTPLRPRMGRVTTLTVALATWAVGAIISMPQLFVFTIEQQRYLNNEVRIICFAEWPDGHTYDSPYEYWNNVMIIVVTFMVPIGSMIYSYARIGAELWGSQSIGECTQRQMDNIKNKRRVVKMMMVVVIIFVVCWLPFHLYFIFVSYYPSIASSTYVQEVYLAIYWLAMSNSMYNPIIYFWMNARFRRGFKQFFSWKTFIRSGPGALTRKEVFTSRRRSYSGSPDHNRIIRNGTSIRTQHFNPVLSGGCPAHTGMEGIRAGGSGGSAGGGKYATAKNTPLVGERNNSMTSYTMTHNDIDTCGGQFELRRLRRMSSGGGNGVGGTNNNGNTSSGRKHSEITELEDIKIRRTWL